MKQLHPFLSFLVICGVAFGLLGYSPALQAQDDETVEGLYQKANTLNKGGKPAEASKAFEKLFEISGPDTLLEDFGPQVGGIFFDCAMTLMSQQRWEDAQVWFQKCANAKTKAETLGAPTDSINNREGLAKFQLAFIASQLGDDEKALELYDSYLSSSPPANELAQVRNSFFLRKATSQLKLGRTEAGIETVQQLFDKKDEWKVQPQFLIQAIFELSMAWIREAQQTTDPDKLATIEVKTHAFLDNNLKHVETTPFDSLRFGLIDRFRSLGFEATKSNLYSVALRILSSVPTLEEVRQDIDLRISQQAYPRSTGPFEPFIAQVDKREKAEMHPDAEVLRLIATCYERLGNLIVPGGIYTHLAENYTTIPQGTRAEVLHEAARFSSAVGDFSSAQYFGDKFFAEIPDTHPLTNNVATFSLQSLFTSRKFDKLIEVCESVRGKHALGSPQRELADALYPMALLSKQRFADAEKPFDEYIEAYPDTNNREMIYYHRGANSIAQRKMSKAAEETEDFLKEFPDSKRFTDLALADLTLARYSLEDYPKAIEAADRLVAAKPNSIQVPRIYNIKGDAYMVASNQFRTKEEAAQKADHKAKGLQAYLLATETAKDGLQSNPAEEGYYKGVASEGIWKSCEQYINLGDTEKALAKYDEFFPDFAGTFWEAQISVFALETLESNGRAEEALSQVEKMINFMGNQPPQSQDITLLRQAIGSYSEASVRIKDTEETIKVLDNFPGLNNDNQFLLTWLKIQKVAVLQQSRKKMERDSPQYAATEARVNEVFEELGNFKKEDLSDYALQQIGLNFSRGDNPFRAVPYFEELLSRNGDGAAQFKAPAEFEIGKIEMRNASKVTSAKERFRRIINNHKGSEFVPNSHLSLAKIAISEKKWTEALDQLKIINKKKEYFKKDREKRAEAGVLLGNAAEKSGDSVGAAKSYLSVLSTYNAYSHYATEAFYRYAKLSLKSFEAGKIPEEEKAKKRHALYKIYLKQLYSWQKLTPGKDSNGALNSLRRELGNYRSDLRISPEDETAIRDSLGIEPEWNPEA